MKKQVFDVLRRAYLPGDSLATMLGKIAAELAQSELLNDATCAFFGVEGSDAPAPDLTNGQTMITHDFPVQHAHHVLGTLRVTPAQGGMTTQAMTLCQRIATCCAYLIKRDAARAWAEDRFDRPLFVAGVCEQVWMVDAFVERAAGSRLPAIVRGGFGTEKEEVAVLLHATGPWRDGPFVAVDCDDADGDPSAWFERAAGGTLYLQGVDELDAALQRQLSRCLRGRHGSWSASGADIFTRVIASTTADLSQRVRAGQFSRALLSQLDVLSIELAALCERLPDIAFHLERVLERHGFDSRQWVTDTLMDALTQYPWPENLLELERVVLRLAVMTAGRPIQLADLQQHAPRLAASLLQGQQRVAGAVPSHPDDGPLAPTLPAAPVDWIDGLPHRPGQRLATLHDALRRALVYLGAHYAEPLTLGDLARQAHVSQSHLGFLFREELGTTFKPLLQQLRIEKAKDLLQREQKLRVTEVALKVGFGDLSHFEKSFRRLVGVSPRAFRNARGQGDLSPV
ncbi:MULTISPECIES: AraC family transcriptional regulator [Xanthomonas]|uniref:AraC family transcriptional regulator n=1 Tax=Xanthomonas TaxID=338 RepID=UPI000E1E8BB6|nr:MULTISPECIES: AraC family transcriptional regulator [Xanthomonas]